MGKAAAVLAEMRRESPDALAWDWEATLERAYRRCLARGSCIVDVGGHAGRHTRVFLDEVQARALWVVEPLPREFAELTRQFGHRAGVRLVRAALSQAPGRAHFSVNTQAREESGLRRRRYNDESRANIESIEVEVTTLDLLLGDAPAAECLDFIKIDVEGAELDVLAGGEVSIRTFRPLVSVEFGSPSFSAYGRHAGELFDLAVRWDYCLMDLLGHAIAERGEWLDIVDAYYWDYLMVPAERAATVSAALARDRRPVPRASPAWRASRAAGTAGGFDGDGHCDSAEAFIRGAYREVLGRDADAAGLGFYLAALLEQRLDRAQILASLRASDEYRRSSATADVIFRGGRDHAP